MCGTGLLLTLSHREEECIVLELSRWRLFTPEVPSVITVVAAVMPPGGSKAGPGFCIDQIKGRKKSGGFLMEATTTQKKLKLSINFPSLDAVISFLVKT